MVRAATIGAIDFAKFDPRDRREWQRLDLILQELHRQDRKEVTKAKHLHWSNLLTVPGLNDETWEDAKNKNAEYLSEIISLYYPWLRDEMASQGGGRDAALAEFREIYGYPGDPQYEEMLQQQAEAWRKIHAKWRQAGHLQEGDE